MDSPLYVFMGRGGEPGRAIIDGADHGDTKMRTRATVARIAWRGGVAVMPGNLRGPAMLLNRPEYIVEEIR